jgi:hypothetical protein
MESIIKTILDDNWVELKDYTEEKTSAIIKQKIDDKKVDVLAQINNIPKEKQEEILNLTK